MLKRYRGRIVVSLIVMIVMSMWNLLFYGLNSYTYNPVLDLPFSLFVIILAFWLASYYDQSKSLHTTLSQSEQDYRNLLGKSLHIFDQLNQIVYQTNDKGVFTLVNPAWEQLTGYTAEETIGKNLFEFVYEEDEDILRGKLVQSITKQVTVFKDEVRIKKQDSGYVWVEINAKYIYDDEGSVYETAGTLSDITDRRTSRLDLIQQNENLALESVKLGAIAQMSASIAHEVRNPLTSISGFLQLMKEQKSFNPEYIDLIFSEMKRIELVLSELLVLSKPQAVTYKKIELCTVIEQVITLMTTETNMKSIEIHQSLPAYPIFIKGEENQLKQVMINLIKNAIDAMDHGGKISLYYSLSPDTISLFIRDEGVGIPEEQLHNIGQAFYTTKEKGTGLGLTVCYKIIENHQGNILIDSKVGEGTTFEIILPLYEEKTAVS
ncbi:hypothetical protein Q73_01215 [Bacillus coahuilensis m2-6]|uniref:ATP-binding protein n=1 Tax=Bacillus coahuilensis TaxID=408580 RepID=UPI00018509D4|nr:ATP-binding protein [Bacillus coahuilensis]KUP09881.1 hypothetical protein Q73_01215 [Bacillus coahuilensis m2-6]